MEISWRLEGVLVTCAGRRMLQEETFFWSWQAVAMEAATFMRVEDSRGESSLGGGPRPRRMYRLACVCVWLCITLGFQEEEYNHERIREHFYSKSGN